MSQCSQSLARSCLYKVTEHQTIALHGSYGMVYPPHQVYIIQFLLRLYTM